MIQRRPTEKNISDLLSMVKPNHIIREIYQAALSKNTNIIQKDRPKSSTNLEQFAQLSEEIVVLVGAGPAAVDQHRVLGLVLGKRSDGVLSPPNDLKLVGCKFKNKFCLNTQPKKMAFTNENDQRTQKKPVFAIFCQQKRKLFILTFFSL